MALFEKDLRKTFDVNYLAKVDYDEAKNSIKKLSSTEFILFIVLLIVVVIIGVSITVLIRIRINAYYGDIEDLEMMIDTFHKQGNQEAWVKFRLEHSELTKKIPMLKVSFFIAIILSSLLTFAISRQIYKIKVITKTVYNELEDAYKKSLKLKNGLINMYDILD